MERGLRVMSERLWLEVFDTLPASDITAASFEPVAALESVVELQPEMSEQTGS